uniref:YadA-like protein n=1 Tax=Myoviridae sp. ctj4n23 TaxID=2825159 RepID=A0A8S5UWK1_9CAUD|nr:MAG TPA: YadA-like protein [Myoviridae sp. ctj4n23]
MNKKVIVSTLAISALAVNVFAQGSNLGPNGTANGDASLVIGTNNTTTTNATSAFVAGTQNTVSAPNGIAFGTSNTVSGENGFAGGNDAKASGRNSFAFGSHAESLVEYTIAIGNQARTASYDSVAIGNGAFVSGESSVAFGRSNNVTGENSVAVGANNGTVAGGQSAVVGYNNKIGSQKEQLVFGSNSEANGQGALVFGTHAKALATDAVAFGNNTIADRANAVTEDAVGVDGVDLNGTRHIFAGEQPGAVVSFGAKARTGAGGVAQYNRQLQNVSAGRVEADSLDAVNGSQLYAAYDEINTLGTKVRNNTADISTLQGTSVNHEGRITALEQRTNNMASEINNRINATEQRINKLGASSAALSGLHPLDFNRNDKVSYAVSYGHYRNSNAVALGAFIRPNERIMVGFGATLGAENQYTINLAFKTGKGSDYLAEAKDAQSRISKLERLVDELTQEVAAQRRI